MEWPVSPATAEPLAPGGTRTGGDPGAELECPPALADFFHRAEERRRKGVPRKKVCVPVSRADGRGRRRRTRWEGGGRGAPTVSTPFSDCDASRRNPVRGPATVAVLPGPRPASPNQSRRRDGRRR